MPKHPKADQPSRCEFNPPWFLRDGWTMTLYAAYQLERYRSPSSTPSHSPLSRFTASLPTSSPLPHLSPLTPPLPRVNHVFTGDRHVPIFGQITGIPNESSTPTKGTIIATYGIVGSLDQQKNLHLLRDKALLDSYTVILFDWRAHGKTATLSPTLTSDGIYEGRDFIHISAQAKALGCPPPYWFMGYSLGGQLALWGVHPDSLCLAENLGLSWSDIGGVAVIAPNLDSNRSLDFLVSSWLGQALEQSITRNLKTLAQMIQVHHPEHVTDEAIARANSIRQFDQELVISRLGFASVEEYYTASSPLPWLSDIAKPVFMLYAADDPMFHPGIVPDLEALAQTNKYIHLCLTTYGGHVGYFSSTACQAAWGDRDPWWAWNRILDWLSDPRKERLLNLSNTCIAQ